MLEQNLTKTLYRFECPPSEQLGEFQFGLLPSPETDAIDQHLTQCVLCQTEIASLNKFIAEIPLPYGLGQAPPPAPSILRKLIAHLVDQMQPGGLQPAFALRGSADANAPRIYQAEEIEIALEIMEDGEQPTLKMMVGLLLAFDPESPLTAVKLQQNSQLISQTEVDELGNFTFHKLQTGSYDIILQGTGIEVHIQSLTI